MATYGKVAVLASAATVIVPAAGVEELAVSIQNRGPNSIYVGNDANVTTGTGTEIGSGKTLSYNRNPNNGVWGIAITADQVSPADTRWLGEPR